MEKKNKMGKTGKQHFSFQVSAINSERDILILAGVMLKVMCILKLFVCILDGRIDIL